MAKKNDSTGSGESVNINGGDAGAIAPPQNGGGNNGPMKWWYDRSPVLRFIILFILFMIIFYSVWATNWFHENFVAAVTRVDASIASFFLDLFGYETHAEGTSVVSPSMTVNVKTGCDGIEAMALFSSGVLAFTASWGHKIKGLIGGIAFLFAVNIVRIIHLWLSGLYMPEYFEFFHQNFWQILFILISIITWAIWINRVSKKPKTA